MTYIFRLYIVFIMVMPSLFSKDNQIHELYRIVMNPVVFETAAIFKSNVVDFCTTSRDHWGQTYNLTTQKSVYYTSLSSTSTAPAYSGEQIENAQAGGSVCYAIFITWNRRVEMATILWHFLELCDKMPALTEKTQDIFALPADKSLKDWQFYPELDEQLRNKKKFWLGGMPEVMTAPDQNIDDEDDEDEDDGEGRDLKAIDSTNYKIGEPAYVDYKKQIVAAFQRTITIESNYATITQTESTVSWFLGQVWCKAGSAVRKGTRYLQEGVICNGAKTFDTFQPKIAHLWGNYFTNFIMFRDFIMRYDPKKPSNSQYTSQYIELFLKINDAQILIGTQE